MFKALQKKRLVENMIEVKGGMEFLKTMCELKIDEQERMEWNWIELTISTKNKYFRK